MKKIERAVLITIIVGAIAFLAFRLGFHNGFQAGMQTGGTLAGLLCDCPALKKEQGI